MKTVLTIAGSDSSGGAGVQADIKTLTMNGVYAMSVITALTAQNTCGVSRIEKVSPAFLKAQLDAVFQDIYPDALKLGMLSSKAIIEEVAGALRLYGAKNIVLDPVMISTSGSSLLEEDAIASLVNELFPLASLITPNIAEAEFLSACNIRSEEDKLRVAGLLYEKHGVPMLLKGGHSEDVANDVLVSSSGFRVFQSGRIANPNTHGTGCTLSSAIAANLAKGCALEQAIERAKAYVTRALEAMLDLGRGSGPLKHNFDLTSSFAE